MISALFLSLAAAPFVVAQSTDIAAIQAHFTQSQIVPDLLQSFDPSATLTVNFEGVGDISPGQALSTDQVAVAPTIQVTPANSSVSLSGSFTVLMVDAEIVGFSDESQGVNHHWIVNGDTLENNQLNNASANAVTPYAGPGPAEGSGAHRYVILVYAQPESFQAPEGVEAGVARFNLNQYVQDSGLGPLVGGTYFTTEVGQATVSVAATSSVVSSTLAGQSSGSASQTASQTAGSATPSDDNGAVGGKTTYAFGFAAALASFLLL